MVALSFGNNKMDKDIKQCLDKAAQSQNPSRLADSYVWVVCRG